MTLTHKSVKALLEDFRSPAPTPGGGSAAALAGAVGASLLAMVARLPTPRAAADADRDRLREAGERCTVLAVELEALVNRDSEAYELVVEAYRLPKGTDEEKAVRTTRIQAALRAAIAAPLDVMRACRAGIALGPVLQTLGSANASSDVQVGLELLRAGLRGGQLNVETNLGGVKDQALAAAITAEIGRISGSGAAGVPSASS